MYLINWLVYVYGESKEFFPHLQISLKDFYCVRSQCQDLLLKLQEVFLLWRHLLYVQLKVEKIPEHLFLMCCL